MTDIAGILCFGVSLNRNDRQPWHPYDDLEDWWIERVHSFKPAVEVFDSTGQKLPNKTQKDVDEYLKERNLFRSSIPSLPYTQVSTLDFDGSAYILAITRTIITAHTEHKKIDPRTLLVSLRESTRLEQFCRAYKVKKVGKPEWFLTARHG
jgi:hypothetical protein